MPEMSRPAKVVCRSAPWRGLAGRVVLPWALQGHELRGDVLEIGCGSGAMAAAALRAFPDVRLTATDYDESMVRAASAELAAFDSRAEVRRADATELPFPDASFDTVLSFVMLHHVVRWEAAIADALRVLRPGGALVGYDLLGDGPGRLLHRRGHGGRLMRDAELRDLLDGLDGVTWTLAPALGGLVTRFTVTSPGGTASP